MSDIFVFDGGFGFTQGMGNGQRVKFPSVYGNHKPAEKGMIGGGGNSLSIKVNSLGEWNFGETAINQSVGGGSRMMDSNKIFTPAFLGSILLAISECWKDNPIKRKNIEVNIVTGLPGTEYDLYSNDKEYKAKFKNFIEGTYQVERPGYGQVIKINSILCTQQGWGPIWQQLINDKGDLVRPKVEADEVLFGCGNVGYNTFELTTVKVYNIQAGFYRFETIQNKQLSRSDGVHLLIDPLMVDLRRSFDQVFKPDQAIKILENGGFMLDGAWQKYQLPQQLADEYSSKIWDHIQGVYGKDLRFLYRFINAGGGANITKDYDKIVAIPQLIVPDKPQWSPILGYQNLARCFYKGK